MYQQPHRQNPQVKYENVKKIWQIVSNTFSDGQRKPKLLPPKLQVQLRPT